MLGIYKLSALSQLVSFTRAMFSPKMLNKQVVITYNFLITLPNTYSSHCAFYKFFQVKRLGLSWQRLPY